MRTRLTLEWALTEFFRSYIPPLTRQDQFNARLLPAPRNPNSRFVERISKKRSPLSQVALFSWGTLSGDSHRPDRFGYLILKNPPKKAPALVVKKKGVTILPSAEGEGVVRFDLSAVPKNAKVYRADLGISRVTRIDGRNDEVLINIEVYPLFAAFKANDEAKPAGKPLAIRGPWFDCLDATGAVQRWVKGETNGGFYVKACPFVNTKATRLEIAYEGKPGKVPQPVTNVRALHRSGQTFITWKEISDPVGKDTVKWGALKMILEGLDRK